MMVMLVSLYEVVCRFEYMSKVVMVKNLVTPATLVMGAAPNVVILLLASMSPGMTSTSQGESLIWIPSRVIVRVYVPAR